MGSAHVQSFSPAVHLDLKHDVRCSSKAFDSPRRHSNSSSQNGIVMWGASPKKEEITTNKVQPRKAKHGSSDVQGVTLKMAFDSQWGVADLSEEKRERFTCGESLDMVHRLRFASDAVLVGRKTVEFDDCSLTVRRVPNPPQSPAEQPFRVIIDPCRQLNLGQYKIATDGLETTIYHHSTATDDENDYSLKYPNIKMVGISTEANNLNDPEGKTPLPAKAILEDLTRHQNLSHLMVEGGPATARQFLEEGLVDRAILVYAPMEFKDPAPSNFSHDDFKGAGLLLLGEYSLGVDRVECWSRPGLAWPSDPLEFWP